MCHPINKFSINQSGSRSFVKIHELISAIDEIKSASYESSILILEMFMDCPTDELFSSTGIQRLHLVFDYNTQLYHKKASLISLIRVVLSDLSGSAQGELFEWITEQYGRPYALKKYGSSSSFSIYRKAMFWDDICNEAVDIEPNRGSRNLDLVIADKGKETILGMEIKISVQNFLTDKPRPSVANKIKYMQLLTEALQSFRVAIYLVSARSFINDYALKQLSVLGAPNVRIETIRALLAS